MDNSDNTNWIIGVGMPGIVEGGGVKRLAGGEKKMRKAQNNLFCLKLAKIGMM